MHVPTRVWFEVVPLIVMFAAFGLIERYAKRHPYGTGHFGEMERRRRAREARRQRLQRHEDDGRTKARNEAVMAQLLGRTPPDTGIPPSKGGTRRRERTDPGASKRTR